MQSHHYQLRLTLAQAHYELRGRLLKSATFAKVPPNGTPARRTATPFSGHRWAEEPSRRNSRGDAGHYRVVRGGRLRVEPEQRLERLVHEHFGRVAAYLLARADAEAAGEALAKTLEVAWRRLDEVPSDPLPWLIGVARKVLADEWRTRRRHQALIVGLTESEAVRPRSGESVGYDAADAATQRLVAIDALSTLTEADREALLLVAWDGLTTRQAAAALGCSRGAFAVRLFRARSRLKEHLDAPPLSEARPSILRATDSGTTSRDATKSAVQENHHE